MGHEHLQIDEHTFLRHFVQNAPQLMWFLGAGTSRSSGLPTAIDVIWDLKRRFYCANEDQDFQSHDVSNQAIREKIQTYFHGKGAPAAWSDDEYSYYFELMFGDDRAAQQAYVQQQLSPDKVTLTIGPRVLASLLEIGKARIVFTTNFDEVLEDAFAAIAGKNLTPFHLEGSYAALDALNAEHFPLYAKIHGDFRYQSIKNISKDLVENDHEIQKCLVAAAGRFGLIIAGFSGRDANVMGMLRDALSQPNPFPYGIWWTVPPKANVAPGVVNFIESARKQGLKAYIVEAGPFDVMLQKIWRQLPDRPQALDQKVRSARANPVSIPLPAPGKKYPILRTNALEVVDAPRQCGVLPTSNTSAADVLSTVRAKQPDAVVSFQQHVLFWGNSGEVADCLVDFIDGDVGLHEFDDPISEIATSTYIKSFYENGLAAALCDNKPLFLRKRGRTCYAVIDFRRAGDERFATLKRSVGVREPGSICGTVSSIEGGRWAECVRIRLEERAGTIFLLLEPDIWITPLRERENAQQLLRERKLRRYNTQSYEILSAWIEILIGPVGEGKPATLTYAPDTSYPAAFTVSTRTAFSRMGSV